MADIFGNSQVPAWLVDAAKPASGKELGQFLGDQMSIMALAMQRDPNAPKDAGWWDSRRGLADAQTDVQNSKIDPMWKQNRDIKLGQWALQTRGRILQNDLAKSRIDLMASTEKNKASSLKAYTDAKLLAGGDPVKFLNMEKPAEITDPTVVNMWIKDKADAGKTAAGLALSQEAMIAGKVKLDRAIRLNKDQQVFSQVFDRDFSETERAAITALGNAPDGSFTPKQVIAMNDTLRAAGKPLIGGKPIVPTAAMKNVEASSQYRAAADALEAAGDLNGAKVYRSKAEAVDKASGRTPFPSAEERRYTFYKSLVSSTDQTDREIARGGLIALTKKGTGEETFIKKQTGLLKSRISSLDGKIAGEEAKKVKDQSKINSYRAQKESSQLELARLNPIEPEPVSPASNPGRFKITELGTDTPAATP